jgi:hypothetical protein
VIVDRGEDRIDAVSAGAGNQSEVKLIRGH